MSIQIEQISNGVLTIAVTGWLKQTEFAGFQKHASEIIEKQGKARFLVLVDKFTGVDRAGDWSDISFQAKYDRVIEKIAIVGDQKWESLVLLFTGKGIRRVPIEYFLLADREKAKAWLAD